MRPDDYHADPCDRPSLSSSIAGELIGKSPRHAWLSHPKLGGIRRKPTKTFDRGSLVHSLLLDAGKDLVVVEADDFKTKAAREARDAAHDAHKIPVLVADLEDATEAAATLRTQLVDDFGIVLDGVSEIAALWTETATDGTEVYCRGLLDHWKLALATIYDLKTCRSGHPNAIQRHIPGYGYDIQAAAYRRAIGKIHPELIGRVDFVFLFAELDPAVTITAVRPAGTLRELGDRKWQRAVDTWAHCLSTNHWPGYAQGIIEIDAPPWALSNDLDAEYAALEPAA